MSLNNPLHTNLMDDEQPQETFASRMISKLAGLRFFTFSALFHIILLILVGGTVLYQQVDEPVDFAPSGGELFATDNTPLPPVEEPVNVTTPTTPTVAPSASSAAPASDMLNAIVSASNANTSFALNAVSTPVVKVSTFTKTDMPAPAMTGTLTKSMAQGIAKFTGGWAKSTGGGRGAPLQKREFEFTAYLAKYAGGDWASTVRMDEKGTMVEGSLPNLLFVMATLSRDKVSGSPQAKPLDLASDEIFEKKPPFIFFTGHRDFVLTDKEIENLRQYIVVGGCLWGDSSLPGYRSRFDLAFRREMRRVIPDIDKDWKEIPKTHPIFTKCYFPDITEVPPGINFYQLPIFAIPGMAGEIGVLYTSNDYGDMWQFGVDENGEIDTSRDEHHHMVAVNEAMWRRRNVYFRNIDGKALLKTYKFGTNIAIHLMTRWESKIGLAATMQ
jgi:hypothetical protein